MSEGPRFTAHFSHEFEDGPSGPARSYWHIRTTSGENLNTLCLHHRDAGNPELVAHDVCYLLEQAFNRGQIERAKQIKKALML